jgi:hypothetical protein
MGALPEPTNQIAISNVNRFVKLYDELFAFDARLYDTTNHIAAWNTQSYTRLISIPLNHQTVFNAANTTDFEGINTGALILYAISSNQDAVPAGISITLTSRVWFDQPTGTDVSQLATYLAQIGN